MDNEFYGKMQDEAYKNLKEKKMPENFGNLQYGKMSKAKLIASLQVARGEIDYLTKQSAEKSDLLGKLKAQYVTVSEAADKEYENFKTDKDDLQEALKAKDNQIKRLTLFVDQCESLLRIVKTAMNSISFDGEDSRQTTLTHD